MRVTALLGLGAAVVLVGGCLEWRTIQAGSGGETARSGQVAPGSVAPGRGKEIRLSLQRFRAVPEFHGRLVALDVLDPPAGPPPPGSGPFLRLTIVSATGTVYVVEDFSTFRADLVTVVADLLAADRIYPHDLLVPRTIE